MSKSITSLAVGDRIKLGSAYTGAVQDIVWQIADKNYTKLIGGYKQPPENSYILIAEKNVASLSHRAPSKWSTYPGKSELQESFWKCTAWRQWLNSTATDGGWYTQSWSGQETPEYTSIRGFLNKFTAQELAVMLTDSDGDRVIMPWAGMVGDSWSGYSYAGPSDIHYYELFTDEAAAGFLSQSIAISTEYIYQAYGEKYDRGDFATLTVTDVDGGGQYHNELCQLSAISTLDGVIYYRLKSTNITSSTPLPVRPVCYISTSARVSDTVDADGCYTMVYNQAPPAPSVINTPTTVYGGQINTISWSQSIDPDGDAVGYVLERQRNSGNWTQVYMGGDRTYTDNGVVYGDTSVRWRVKAYDIYNDASAYTISSTKSVTNNRPPVISGTDTSLGEYGEVNSMVYTYTVTDADNDPVTVTVKIDGKTVSVSPVTLGQTQTISYTNDQWRKVLEGQHTISITANDGKETATRTVTFIKTLHKVSFTSSAFAPVEGAMPVSLSITAALYKPVNSSAFFYTANNGNDTSPTWEDCTDKVNAGQPHTYTNSSKTADSWGVKVRGEMYDFAPIVKYMRGTSEVNSWGTVDQAVLCEKIVTGGYYDGREITRSSGNWSETLSNYGITVTTTPQNGDKIVIAVNAATEKPYILEVNGVIAVSI